MKSASEEHPLNKLSPFAVQKGFQAIAGTLKSIRRLRNGSFLVECNRATNLLKTEHFVDRLVQVTIHKTLNSSKGVIRCKDMSGMSELEIRDEPTDQGVTEVRRVTLKKGGLVVPTNTLFLTFNQPCLRRRSRSDT